MTWLENFGLRVMCSLFLSPYGKYRFVGIERAKHTQMLTVLVATFSCCLEGNYTEWRQSVVSEAKLRSNNAANRSQRDT